MAALVLAGGAAILSLAAAVRPDPSGMGTHRQFGLPPCSMVVLTGYPCPTCGMTTAFAHVVRGHLLSALGAQPAGAILALATLASVLMAARALVTGRAPGLPLWLTRWDLVPMLIVALILLGWGVKIAMLVLNGEGGA